MKLLIKNGTIVNDSGQQRADVLIENALIKAVGSGFEAADEIIDATGCFIFPGGLDPHVHMELDTPFGRSSDDFLTGSRAALAGGTTTMIDFVTPHRGQSILEARAQRLKQAERAFTDCFFHISPVEFSVSAKNELLECIRLGVKSFKVYMAYKGSIGLNDNELFEVLQLVGNAGGIVAVHCELGDEIEQLRNSYFDAGMRSPVYHAASRPPHTESEAVQKVIQMAAKAGCALYLVHISAAASLLHIKNARETGQEVYAETCPQYLMLDDSRYVAEFQQSAPYVISPPLRKSYDSQALWAALSSGILQAVGTDHCPFMFEQKAQGINDFRKIPNGAGGVEHRLALLYTYGVLQGRISIEQFVGLTSAMPARIFGFYPRKGLIAAGSDADVVVWKPDVVQVISAKTHHQRCDTNIYEGIETHGRPEFVVRAGQLVVREGKLHL